MMLFAAMEIVDIIAEIIGIAIVIAVVGFWIRLHKHNKALEAAQADMTQPETVHAQICMRGKSETLGKRKYYVNFRTDDGREIRLSVSHKMFVELKKSDLVLEPRRAYHVPQAGMLTYQGTELIRFEHELPEQSQ